MAALLDLLPDTDAVSAGVADVHFAIDRLHMAPVDSSRPSADVAEVDRAIRRLESYKLKLVAAADSAGVARTPGSPVPTPGSRGRPMRRVRTLPRQVALASELESGHDATAEALDAGRVSPITRR